MLSKGERMTSDLLGNNHIGIGTPPFDRDYICPKHGNIGACIIAVSMESCPQNGLYCQRCWVEHLAATCEEVKEKRQGER